MPTTIHNPNAPLSASQLAPWTNLARSLIESLATHAVRWHNEEDYEGFRQELAAALDALTKPPGPASLQNLACTLPQGVKHYQQKTQHAVDNSVSELHEIIRVLMSSLDEVQLDCEDTASALQQIEQTLGKTSTAEDLRAAKVRLTQALGKLAEKEQARKQRSAELVTILHERVLVLEYFLSPGAERPAPGPLSAGGHPRVAAQGAAGTPAVAVAPAALNANPPGTQIDSLTGLPNREAAESTIIAAQANPAGLYLVALYVQRLEHFNARFGDKIGNELLFLTAQRLVNGLLLPGDQMFRWRGPAFVALLKRDNGAIDVRREVQRVAGSKFQFDLRGGAILASIAAVSATYSVDADHGVGMIQELEKYFSLPATRGQ